MARRPRRPWRGAGRGRLRGRWRGRGRGRGRAAQGFVGQPGALREPRDEKRSDSPRCWPPGSMGDVGSRILVAGAGLRCVRRGGLFRLGRGDRGGTTASRVVGRQWKPSLLSPLAQRRGRHLRGVARGSGEAYPLLPPGGRGISDSLSKLLLEYSGLDFGPDRITADFVSSPFYSSSSFSAFCCSFCFLPPLLGFLDPSSSPAPYLCSLITTCCSSTFPLSAIFLAFLLGLGPTIADSATRRCSLASRPPCPPTAFPPTLPKTPRWARRRTGFNMRSNLH